MLMRNRPGLAISRDLIMHDHIHLPPTVYIYLKKKCTEIDILHRVHSCKVDFHTIYFIDTFLAHSYNKYDIKFLSFYLML